MLFAGGLHLLLAGRISTQVATALEGQRGCRLVLLSCCDLCRHIGHLIQDGELSDDDLSYLFTRNQVVAADWSTRVSDGEWVRILYAGAVGDEGPVNLLGDFQGHDEDVLGGQAVDQAEEQ